VHECRGEGQRERELPGARRNGWLDLTSFLQQVFEKINLKFDPKKT
jgi:hypothetical protein